ncbi:MAG: gamma-glutamylcyclotransferase family protein [Rhodospirillaceae bacterium]
MRFFFYGTLIDPDVRTLVLGREAAASCRVEPANLPGWRAVRVQGKTYPAVVERRGATTGGMIADGLPEAAMARLIAYEGPEYVVRDLPVEIGADGGRTVASVFVAGPECRITTAFWRFADWERRDKRRFVAALRSGRLV